MPENDTVSGLIIGAAGVVGVLSLMGTLKNEKQRQSANRPMNRSQSGKKKSRKQSDKSAQKQKSKTAATGSDTVMDRNTVTDNTAGSTPQAPGAGVERTPGDATDVDVGSTDVEPLSVGSGFKGSSDVAGSDRLKVTSYGTGL